MLENFNQENESVQNPTSDFADLGRLFLELKGQGACLSSNDVDILMKWKLLGYKVQELSDYLIELYNFYNSQNKSFPKCLTSIDRELSTIKSKWG